MKTLNRKAMLTGALLLACLLLAACGQEPQTPTENQGSKRGGIHTAAPEAATTRTIEIRNYQGQKLGSVNDFRENSIKGVPNIDIESYRLQIGGLVKTPRLFTYEELKELPRRKKVITLNCVEGWSVTALWEGFPLAELFALVEPKAEANTVIFYAADGYSTSLPLEYITAREIMLADKINGITLPAARGFPFQLVAEDKWGYKWIRWLTRIELSDNPEYRGFWEQRGYSRKGDADGPMFE